MLNKDKVQLGDRVQDCVTGFKGVVVSQHNYLHGCTRFSVQPKINKGGEYPDVATFDEPQLKLLKKAVVKGLYPEDHASESKVTGGVDKFADEGKSI